MLLSMSMGVTSQVMKAPANPRPSAPSRQASLNGNPKIGLTPTSPPLLARQHNDPDSTDEIDCHSKTRSPLGSVPILLQGE